MNLDIKEWKEQKKINLKLTNNLHFSLNYEWIFISWHWQSFSKGYSFIQLTSIKTVSLFDGCLGIKFPALSLNFIYCFRG
jgi:hypothetical protein